MGGDILQDDNSPLERQASRLQEYSARSDDIYVSGITINLLVLLIAFIIYLI